MYHMSGAIKTCDAALSIDTPPNSPIPKLKKKRKKMEREKDNLIIFLIISTFSSRLAVSAYLTYLMSLR